MKKIYISILLSLFVISYCESVTLLPSDDMYTDHNHPGVSPVTTELWTANFNPSDHFERIMMKFDLDEYNGVDLQSATLDLTRFYSCPSGGTTVTTFYPIAEVWDENSWNHTVHIELNEDISMPFIFSGPGGITNYSFSVDVTDFIRNFIDGTVENKGFAIVANNNQKFSKFYSKEHSNDNFRPRLTLEYNEVSIGDNDIVPEIDAYCYPNPFNPKTTINFKIPEAGDVKITIYNMNGRTVRNLVSQKFTAGVHQVHWNGLNNLGKQCSGGVYFYKVGSSNYSVTNRMVLVK